MLDGSSMRPTVRIEWPAGSMSEELAVRILV